MRTDERPTDAEARASLDAIIEHYGTYRRAADALGVPSTASLHHWRNVNLPSWRRREVCEHAASIRKGPGNA